MTLDAADAAAYLVARGVVPRGRRADRRGARRRRFGHRARGARAGHRTGRQAGAPAACAWPRSGSRPRAAPTPRRPRSGSRRASSPAACRRSSTAIRASTSSCCSTRRRLAQLAGRVARRPRAYRVRPLGRRHARRACTRDGGRRRGRGRVRRLRGLRAAATRAVSRSRDGAPPPARRRARAARRGAARRAHLPRARRLRAQEHPARARRRLDARRGGRARRQSGLRPRVLPRLPLAHGACSKPRARGLLQRDPRGLHGGLRAARARPAAPVGAQIAAHTGAMLLARTDGRSPADFLDARGGRAGARARPAPAADPRRTCPRSWPSCG